MIRLLQKYYPDFSRAEDAEIVNEGRLIGWHCNLFCAADHPIGSGCSKSKDTSRRVAVAEALERGVFRELFSRSPKPLLLDEFPTTSGFAAGFEEHATKLRAVAEAVERWAWSQWIDEGHFIQGVTLTQTEVGEIGSYFMKEFDSMKFFHKIFEIDFEGAPLKLQFGVSLGIKANGIFAGSRVCSIEESPWEHGIVEAWRHILISNRKPVGNTSDIYLARVRHFSENASAALERIDSSKVDSLWPQPRLRMLQRAPGLPDGLHVWRALCHDFTGWHLGDKTRFVY